MGKSVDNISLIRQYLEFSNDKDLIYYIQILARRKDNPGMKGDNRTLKFYTVDSLEAYDKVAESVKRHCEFERARGYIHLTPRSKKNIAVRTLQDIANNIAMGQFDAVKNSYSSCLGRYPAPRAQRKWVVDLDFPSDEYLTSILKILFEVEPVDLQRLLIRVPTKNGIHLITVPFNRQRFIQLCRESNTNIPDIHDNNPTVLYIPESIMGE